MGKATKNNSLNMNKLAPPAIPTIEEIHLVSSFSPPPVYHPLFPKQKEKILEAVDRKYKDLEEKKPLVEVLENSMTYRKKLDEVMMGRARLENKEFGDEEKAKLIKNGLPKKMCDPGNFVLPVRVNKTTQMSALADTGSSISVLPFILYKNLGLGDLRPYYSNLTMADNRQAKAMREVRNVRIQIGYQAYLTNFLVLDIPVDNELPLLLGHPFLRTCGVIIDMRRGTMIIDDGVIRHTYFPKPRAKTYLENFEVEEEDDWLGCFEVGRDEDGNPKYGPVAPSFLDIEDEMERALAMEAYFNPFKNIIVFKNFIDFLGSLPIQLKHTDWGSKGHGVYRKTEGDELWQAKFEVISPSQCKFTRGFKTKETKRKLSGASEFRFYWFVYCLLSLILSILYQKKNTPPNPLISKYKGRNGKKIINYSLKPVTNAYLKWHDLPSMERHTYNEQLSRLQQKDFAMPRLVNWEVFYLYGCDETLRNLMKMEYTHEDRDEFVDYS
ncbi:putative ribonuclease H-like domain-containing protein [Tanacetum coccineum]